MSWIYEKKTTKQEIAILKIALVDRQQSYHTF